MHPFREGEMRKASVTERTNAVEVEACRVRSSLFVRGRRFIDARNGFLNRQGQETLSRSRGHSAARGTVCLADKVQPPHEERCCTRKWVLVHVHLPSWQAHWRTW